MITILARLKDFLRGQMMCRLSNVATYALMVGVGLTGAGCGQVGMLQAKMAIRDAHAAYQAQDYRKAVEKYEAALVADPTFTQAYFFLGNSYDNLYMAGGGTNRDQLLAKAVDNYKLAAEKDPTTKKLALQYLVAAYGSDKLNDAGQAEPLLKELIALDPKDPATYFQLAKIYEDNGDYEQAEQKYNEAKDARPTDPTVYMQLAGYHNRQGDFDKTMDALNQRVQHEPSNPEAYYTVATYYWDKVYRDFRLKDADKKMYVQSGVNAIDKAISIKSDYIEALIYKGLLLRLEANLEKDPGKQQALLKEAEKLNETASDLRKKKAAGAGD